MTKRNLFLLTFGMIIFVFAFSGCGKTNFYVNVADDSTVEIGAENASKDMAASAGSINVAEGQTLHFEPALKKGEIDIKFNTYELGINAGAEEVKNAPEGGDTVLDVKISGDEAVDYEIDPGTYNVAVQVLSKASGTILIKVR